MSKKRENQHKRWTQEDVEYLLDNYGGNVSLKTLAKRLKRSEKALVYKHYDITQTTDLKLASYDFTTSLLMEGMGVSKTCIYRWIKNKGLKYTTTSNNPKSPRKYNVTAFYKWVREHKELIDFKKCKEGVLLPEPKWFVEEIRKAKLETVNRRDRWTDNEIKRMMFLHDTGKTKQDIANELNRTYSSVKHKLKSSRDIS